MSEYSSRWARAKAVSRVVSTRGGATGPLIGAASAGFSGVRDEGGRRAGRSGEPVAMGRPRLFQAAVTFAEMPMLGAGPTLGRGNVIHASGITRGCCCTEYGVRQQHPCPGAWRLVAAYLYHAGGDSRGGLPRRGGRWRAGRRPERGTGVTS